MTQIQMLGPAASNTVTGHELSERERKQLVALTGRADRPGASAHRQLRVAGRGPRHLLAAASYAAGHAARVPARSESGRGAAAAQPAGGGGRSAAADAQRAEFRRARSDDRRLRHHLADAATRRGDLFPEREGRRPGAERGAGAGPGGIAEQRRFRTPGIARGERLPRQPARLRGTALHTGGPDRRRETVHLLRPPRAAAAVGGDAPGARRASVPDRAAAVVRRPRRLSGRRTRCSWATRRTPTC